VPIAAKIALWVIVIAAAIVVLFGWVFPWVESLQQDPTMGLHVPTEVGVHGPGVGFVASR
jgi:hypothetical protein